MMEEKAMPLITWKEVCKEDAKANEED